jgi:hypothetical protein
MAASVVTVGQDGWGQIEVDVTQGKAMVAQIVGEKTEGIALV